MAYDFSNLKQGAEKTIDWLKKEYSVIRTGRSTPVILDGIKVEVYDSKMPVNQIATVSLEGPKILRVVPWDLSLGKNIEKAITAANLGLSVVLDDKGVRVHFPDLSEERRNILIKLARQKLEESKIRLRGEREKTWEEIQKKVQDGALGEDDKFRLKNEMQKIIEEVGEKLEELSEHKEKEIMN